MVSVAPNAFSFLGNQLRQMCCGGAEARGGLVAFIDSSSLIPVKQPVCVYMCVSVYMWERKRVRERE